MKKLTIVFLMFFSIFLLSCNKNYIEPTDNNKIENLNVSDNFDWKTTKDYYFTINTNNDGLLVIQSINGINYLKLFVDNGENNFKLTLPSYENKIYIMLNGIKIEKELLTNQIKQNF